MANPGVDGHRPQLWFYRLRATDGKDFEWAEVVLGSNGLFAAVSDYGNYSFRWTHFGDRDFRLFMLGLGPDYVRCKLNPAQVLDDQRTISNLQHAIALARRARKMDRWEARDAWDRAGSVHDQIEVNDWINNFGSYVDEYWELCVFKPEPQVTMFCERILARLQEAIRAELIAESALVQRVVGTP